MPVHALPAPMRVHMISPLTFNNAQEIGDRIKAGSSVFLDLRAVDRDLDERLRDFCIGLIAALDGSITDVAQSIILVAPSGISVSRGSDQASARTTGGEPRYRAAMDAEVTPLFGSLSA